MKRVLIVALQLLLLISLFVDGDLAGISTAKADAQNGYIGFRFGEITDTQQLDGLDFEFPLLIELIYDYEEFIETTIQVKKSGI